MKMLEDGVHVAGQIAPEDMAALKAAGFAAIVNNRPDGEEPGQPSAAAIAAAAGAAGLSCRHIPVAGGLREEDVAAMADALAAAEGPLLAFCRSGTRSAFLWALARVRDGVPGDTLARRAAAAGYDLAPIRRLIG